MNQGKRTLSLVLSLITMCGALVACDEDYYYPDADWREGYIANVAGKDYTYDEIYKLFEDSKDSARAYYSTAKNVLAQFVTKKTDAISVTVDTKIATLHDTWKTNARTNGTTYKTEKEKTLDSEGVEDEDELRAKYIAEEQNTLNSKNFYSEVNGDAGETESKFYISEDETKEYVKNAAPYHVSHILVKVDASSSGEGLWNGQISSSNAQKIGDVVRMLTSTDSFGSIAQLASDDTSSAVQYGELYTANQSIAMEKTTSYINEFKLGLYTYDAFLNPNTKTNDKLKASLRVPGKEYDAEKDNVDFDYKNDTSVAEDIKDTLAYNAEAFGIPVSEAFTLRYVSETEKNPETGGSVSYATATQYPRNIIFNNYFNYHGVNFIYDDSAEYDAKFLADAQAVGAQSGKVILSLNDVKTQLPAKYEEYLYVKNQLNAMSATKFKLVDTVSDKLVGYNYDVNGSLLTETLNGKNTYYTSLGTGKSILVTEKGDPIVIVRGGTSGDSGYQGIHFMTINNDPFVDADTKYNYYRVNIPDADSTVSAETTDYSKNPSFINYVKADVTSNTTYNERRKAVEAAIKAADTNIDFKLWDSNVAKFNSTHSKTFADYIGKDAYAQIENYISKTRESTKTSNEDSLDSSWETYIQQLNLQADVTPRGIVPTVCVSYFESGNFDGKEDLCHVEK